MIDLTTYLSYAIQQLYIHKWLWVTSMFGIHEDGYSNKYLKNVEGINYVLVDEVWLQLNTTNENGSAIAIDNPVTALETIFKSVMKSTKTTVGKLLLNYLLIEKPFNGKLPYIVDNIKLSNIITMITKALSTGDISVVEYEDFVSSCTYLESFNKLVTPSSTEKLMLPPPGLDKYKTELRKEFVDKYGKDWTKDPARVVSYDDKLKQFYDEYIATDPSNGIIANKKNKNNALAKKYLTFSSTNAFGDQTYIEESLLDGYPKDPTKLAAMFNTIRSASFNRGSETQKGGAVAKSVLRATSSVTITKGDCGVKYGKSIAITKQNANNLIGRYLIVGNKVIGLNDDNINDYIGSIVIMRSPMYCITPKPSLCSICSGDKAGSHEHGVALIVTNISSVLTTSALKSMHNSQLSTVNVSIGDILF